MSNKRSQTTQGGYDRVGQAAPEEDMADKPQRATAAQMARRTIANARKPSGSQRSSRAGTPTAQPNPFGQQQGSTQSMPSFQLPNQSDSGFGGGAFNFAVNAATNPFANTNGASSTPPPTSFQFGGSSKQPQQNGVGGLFGNSNASFGSNNAQPQQNGFTPSTTMFGQSQPDGSQNNTSSIFSGFGQNSQSQPQQNGLTPSTNNSFPSFGQQSTDNPFKGFQTQSQQQTQNTANTSFNSFSQSTQANGDKTPSAPFTFGQTNTQSQPTAAKPLFGSSTAADQTPKTATSNVFAGFGSNNNQSQQNGDTSLFMPPSDSEQTPKPSAGGLFGGQQSTGKSLFGATPPPDSRSQTPKPGESVFGAVNKKDGISSDMFTRSRDQTPQPTTNNLFGAKDQQPPQQTESSAPAQTPKPTNIFSSTDQPQTNGPKPSLFGNSLFPQPDQQTPKPSSNMFSFGQQSSNQAPATSPFKFGQSLQDASMTTPGNTPQKPSTSTQPSASTATASAAPSQTPNQGVGLFGSTSTNEAPPTTQQSLFQPSTSMFHSRPPSDTPSQHQAQQTPAAQTSDLFDRTDPKETPATVVKPAFNPSTSFLSKPADQTAAPWLSHAPALNVEQATPQQPAATAPTAPSQTSTRPAAKIIPDDELKTLKVLNEGLRAHIATQDPRADWTPILQYTLQQVAKIRKKPEPAFDAAPVTQAASTPRPVAPANVPTPQPFTAQPSVSASVPKNNLFAAAASQSSALAQSASQSNIFGTAASKPSESTLQATPKPSSGAQQSLLQPPQTAPVNRKRPAEDEAEQAPATEKRARSQEPTAYPQLPDNASETAKLFQAALNKSSSNALGASNTGGAGSALQGEAEKESQPSAEGPKPSATGFTPATGGFKPSAPSGMPTFSAGSANSFLSAFGKKANEEAENAKKRRHDEHYDSDDETEEEWAKRDKEEQEAKRQKIMSAAKTGASFTFTPSAGNTPAPESDFGEGSDRGSDRDQDTDADTPPLPSKSLFDRITPRDSPAPATSTTSLFSSQAPATSKSSANLFAPKTPSSLGANSITPNFFSQFSKPRDSIEKPDGDKTEAEKDQGAGDHTWQPNTPIKFGAGASAATESTTPATAPPLSNLFGAISQKPNSGNSTNLNIPKPSFGFNFGAQPSSAGTSRATTPGVTTDGEGASTAGEEDAEEGDQHAQSEPQVEDQTGLRDSEKENEDLLFSVHMAKGMKNGEKKNDEGEIAWGWIDKGKGPLYILKHKETGKVRVVLKVPPYGTPRMNFEPLNNMAYEVQGGSGKMVQGVFVDHLDEKSTGKLSKWLVQVGKAEDAKEMAKVLMENRPSKGDD